MSARAPVPAWNPLGGRDGATQLAALTGLRFWLALWVILHHLTGPGTLLGGWAQSLSPPMQALVRGGYLSVNVFFVLSGFVLARGYASTRWDRENLLRYGIRRFARIYPVYLLSLFLVMPFIAADRLPWIGETLRGSKAALVTAYVLVLQGWGGKLGVGWNTPAWSLSCEIFFYALFPIIALCMRKRGWTAPLVMTAISLALPGALRACGVPDDWKPLVHVADFLIGMAAAGFYDLILRKRPVLIGRGHWSYTPAVAICVFLIARNDVLYGWTDLNSAVRPFCAVLIVSLALGGGWLDRVLSARPSVHLGRASYAVYILHIPIMWWYKRWFSSLFGVVPGACMALVYLLLVVAISSGVFLYFEEPVNRWFRKQRHAMRRPRQKMCLQAIVR